MFSPFSYARPTGLKQASANLEEPNAYLYAGGTDLLGCMRDHIFQVEKVVSMMDLPRLKGIRDISKGLALGALTTITEIAEDSRVAKRYPVLAQAASEVASPQIRNQGTIGGNVCQKPRCWYYRGDFDCLRKGGSTCFALKGESHYHAILGGKNCFMVHPSDPLPALAALDAVIVAKSPGGERTIPAETFAMDPAQDPTRETVLDQTEVVTEIRIPRRWAGVYSAYRKVRARRSWDFSLAGAALVLDLDGDKVLDARLVFSGVAPIPWRAKGVERLLKGRTLDRRTMEEAAREAVGDASPLRENGYKVPLLQGVIREELAKAARTR